MEDAEKAIGFAALGHPIRLALFRRMLAAGAAGIGPTALADAIGQQRTLVAHHLRPLVAARLVVNERRGREVVYRVDPVSLGHLALALQSLALERP